MHFSCGNQRGAVPPHFPLKISKLIARTLSTWRQMGFELCVNRVTAQHTGACAVPREIKHTQRSFFLNCTALEASPWGNHSAEERGECSELAFAQLHCERRTAHRVHGRPHVDKYRFGFWEWQKVNPHLRSELFPPADLTQPDLFGCGVGELFGRPTTRNG